MNLGIDIDGTLTAFPAFFVELGRAWRAKGWKVYLITGLGKRGVEERRKKWTVLNDTSFYDAIIDTSLYNDDERALIGQEPDNELIVGRFKQRMCRELFVAIMFDDMAAKHRSFGDVPIFEVPKVRSWDDLKRELEQSKEVPA